MENISTHILCLYWNQLLEYQQSHLFDKLQDIVQLRASNARVVWIYQQLTLFYLTSYQASRNTNHQNTYLRFEIFKKNCFYSHHILYEKNCFVNFVSHKFCMSRYLNFANAVPSDPFPLVCRRVPKKNCIIEYDLTIAGFVRYFTHMMNCYLKKRFENKIWITFIFIKQRIQIVLMILQTYIK